MAVRDCDRTGVRPADQRTGGTVSDLNIWAGDLQIFDRGVRRLSEQPAIRIGYKVR